MSVEEKNEEKKTEKPRVQGPMILMILLGLGIIAIGLVLMAATGGQTPKVHAPQVLPPASH
jgi:hypothetical protein